MSGKPLLVVENLPVVSAGNETEVIGGKVTFSHSTEPFQCQTSLLCPPYHIWRGNIHYISQFSPIEYIICISTHCAQFTHSTSVHIHVYILYLYMFLENAYFFVLSLNNFFFPSWYNMLGGWWATLSAIVLPWPRTAGSCAWHEAQKQGEDKHSQQTLTDVHKSTDAYLLHSTHR